MPGRLILCATPIGNLEDITFRVVRALKEADIIAAEDTRNSIKLLSRFDIHTPMTAYHENNRYEKGRELVKKMQDGATVALVTDAGTPGISDPGEVLVGMCVSAGIEVTSLPGPAACITALTVSALPTRRFCFEAFLPREKKERREVLRELSAETRTIIIYEAPHRLEATLQELAGVLGESRRISVCRELTKKHEDVMRTTLGRAADFYDREQPRGEYVLVIEGISREEKKAADASRWEKMDIGEHVALYEAEGMDRKEAMKAAAKDRGIGKREIYAWLEEHKEEDAKSSL